MSLSVLQMQMAMEATLAKACEVGLDNMSSDCAEADYPHLVDMFQQAQEFTDEGKMGRWLGWMQACVVINSMGQLDLQDMVEINKGFVG